MRYKKQVSLCACGHSLKCEGSCRKDNFKKDWGICPAHYYDRDKSRQTGKGRKAKSRNASKQLHSTDSSGRNSLRGYNRRKSRRYKDDVEGRGSSQNDY